MIQMPHLETNAPSYRRGLLSASIPAGVGMAAGTRVETMTGSVAVEDLVPGMVLDTTEGPQTVLRVVACRPGTPAAGEQVEIVSGVAGRGRPLVLAAEQRIVVSGWIAELHFGVDAVEMTAGTLRHAGFARTVSGMAEATLYLPIVSRPCAVYAGAIALSLGCVAQDALAEDSALSDSLVLTDAEAALVMSLLGTKTLH